MEYYSATTKKNILPFVATLMYIKHIMLCEMGVSDGASDKVPACQCKKCKRHGLNRWVTKIPWRRKWQPPPVLLPGESHGERSLAGYSP